MQWYAKELGMTHLAARIDDTLKIAMEQGWNLEQTLHALFEGEYERRLVGRQKARIKTFVFKFISVPAKWIKTSRRHVLNIYSDNNAYANLFKTDFG